MHCQAATTVSTRRGHTRTREPVADGQYQRNKQRLGKQRGAKVAQVDVARCLAEAI